MLSFFVLGYFLIALYSWLSFQTPNAVVNGFFIFCGIVELVIGIIQAALCCNACNNKVQTNQVEY